MEIMGAAKTILFIILVSFSVIAGPTAEVRLKDSPYGFIPISLDVNETLQGVELDASNMNSLFGDEIYDESEGTTDNNILYTQECVFGDGIRFTGERLEFDSSSVAYEYILDFSSPVVYDVSDAVDDIESTALIIQGTTYTVTEAEFSEGILTRLSLIKGNSLLWMAEGESIARLIDDTDHTIKMIDVANLGDSCGFEVDGSTVWIDVGDTETVHGVSLAVTEARAINNELSDGDICKVIIGASEYVLTDGEAMEIGSSVVDGTAVSLSGNTQSSAGNWTGLRISYSGNDVIQENKELIDPLFATISIELDEITGVDRTPPQIGIIQPEHGDDIINKTTLYVKTDEEAECEYEIITHRITGDHTSSSHSLGIHFFSSTGGTEHYQVIEAPGEESDETTLKVTCTDPSGNYAYALMDLYFAENEYESIESTIRHFMQDMDFSIVIGADSSSINSHAATNIGLYIQNKLLENGQGILPPDINMLDTEADADDSIISIGWNNTITSEFLPGSLPLADHTAIVAVVEHGTRATIVIAGKTDDDTYEATRIIYSGKMILNNDCYIMNTYTQSLDECSLDEMLDCDQDGIRDNLDMLIFSPGDLDCNIDLDVLINNTNASTWSGTGIVGFASGNSTLVEFEHDFSQALDLSGLSVYVNSNGVGSIEVRGVPEGHTKTVYIDKLDQNMKYVCVKDSEEGSISTGCTASDEVLLTCDGTLQSGYLCKDLGDSFRIEGLLHSSVSQACTDTDKDGYYKEGGACGSADCDDSDNEIYPGAKEIRNNKDDDCDGSTDEGFSSRRSSGGSSGGGRTICTPDWVCSDWSECIDGLQTRECNDTKHCGATSPNTEMECEMPEVEVQEAVEEIVQEPEAAEPEPLEKEPAPTNKTKQANRTGMPTGMAVAEPSGKSIKWVYTLLVAAVAGVALYIFRGKH